MSTPVLGAITATLIPLSVTIVPWLLAFSLDHFFISARRICCPKHAVEHATESENWMPAPSPE